MLPGVDFKSQSEHVETDFGKFKVGRGLGDILCDDLTIKDFAYRVSRFYSFDHLTHPLSSLELYQNQFQHAQADSFKSTPNNIITACACILHN